MRLTATGAVIMVAANLAVWGMTIWCFWRVLTAPAEDQTPPPPSGFGA
ncbi:MAG: hypothetical protein AB7L66_08260 [Gemmatimonadales bacterium]